MEKSELTKIINNIRTAGDLANVLDKIKRIEFGAVRYSISEKMLRYFSSDSISPKRFRRFHIKKKSGGLREIKAPCQQLDIILSCVNILLKSIYEPSDVAMGFTPGRSVLKNAQIHVGHNYVFNIDLKDFFPSILQVRVWKRLQLAPFNFSKEIANILAGLCCSYDANANANVLPQGSPASPLLTNAICDKLDRQMKGVAKRFGLHYSRYADDMTFSSMHNVYQEGSEFRTEIQRIISEQGFRINESKTRLQKTGARQEVTGLTVNAIANVSRQYISDLRWLLSVWEKEGYAKAYALFYPKYKHEKGYIKKGEPVMENVAGGKLDYLRMVRGASNPAYQKLAARFARLQELVFVDNETDSTKSYVYVQPYTLADFQSLFHTTITLEVSRKGKVIGKCSIDNREKVLAISKSTQEILCPDLDGKSIGDSIYSQELDKCFVTLCRNRGKNFWLITHSEPKRSRCLSVQNLNINPDELLTLWEKNGFKYTADKLALFIQYGNRGESILDWNQQSNIDDITNIDRGFIADGKVLLLKYFLRNKSLTGTEKARLLRLIKATIPNEETGVYVEHLLDIWEKEGLDAAVKVWGNLYNSNCSDIPKNSTNSIVIMQL
ncbi:MAG: reverse transcriptase family protein [Bacteroidales bacterium]|nr:reverse transcriptase family protein [Bacteroidales bacterium]